MFIHQEKEKLIQGKKLLCIDYGEKVVGLASYRHGSDPYVLKEPRLIFESLDKTLNEITQFVNDELVDIIIFGVPYLLDGKETDQSKKLLNIARQLASQLSDQAVYIQDETLSTQTAKERMLESPEYNFKVDLTQIDSLSAVIILEDFLKSDSTLQA